MGVLNPTNAYCNPFYAFYPKCTYKFDNYGTIHEKTTHCTKCNEDVEYIYYLHIKVFITKDNNQAIHYFAEKNIAENFWPSLKNMTYEEYINDKSTIIFLL